MLQKEGIESVVEVILKILGWRDVGENLAGNVLVVAEDFIQRVGPEAVACLEVEEFAERESPEVVTLYNTVEFGVFFLEPHHA